MSFIDRSYPDVVRDVLTHLTQGVARELHFVDYDPKARPLVVPDIVLERRPVKRISFVSGFLSGAKDGDPAVPYVFTLNDYQQVADDKDPADLNRIRFLPFGKKPAPGTFLTVNYFPRIAEATPITDLNVGSVVRTLLEAVSREVALAYSQLNLVYDSAFLETAEGASLERVVALLGYSRFQAGRAVGAVTFSRRQGSLGNITIPAGTPITDTADKIRYETAESHDMLAGESKAQVRVRGATASTPPVEAGVLTVVQRVIAGIDQVTNERPTTRASDDESDEDLRARARVALLGANKGTVESITNGLLQLPEVRDAKVVEMPNGVPGEIKVVISRADGKPAGAPLPVAVESRLEQLRPAGIRVVTESAASAEIAASVTLVLAGSALAPPQVEQVREGVRQRLVAEIKKKGVGEKVRIKPLVASLLDDERIADAEIMLAPKGEAAGSPGTDLAVPAGTTVTLQESDISFGADTFEEAPPTGVTVRVEVRAVVAAQPLAGVTADSVRAALKSRLEQLFGSLAAGTALDLPSVLNAVRNDAQYAIDPLKTQLTLTSEQQFAQILQGGAAFTVGQNQSFTVVSVELAA